MLYSDFKSLVLVEGDGQDVKKFTKLLKNSERNQILNILQDYYDGNDWDFNPKVSLGSRFETRFSRSGKEMWKPFDENNMGKGLKEGELKVWNIIKSSIDIYANYARGDQDDQVKINVYVNDAVDSNLTDIAQSLFEEPERFVSETVVKMSVNSVYVGKYTKLEQTSKEDVDSINEQEILRKLQMKEAVDEGAENLTAIIEEIDPREIEPLYWKNTIRGFVRFYEISKNTAMTIYADKLQGVKLKKGNTALYWECWYIDDSANFMLDKYIDDNLVETGTSPYTFLPFIFQPNRKHPFSNFDLDHIEISDVADLVDLQDDINAYITDLAIILRKVAIPMLKATDEFIKSATEKDMTKMKQMFTKLNTMAGQLIFAPVEKMNTTDIGTGSIQHLQDMKEQFYMQTGIPKSIFNSEGLSNIAAQTLDYLFQSLAKRVGDKRQKVTEIIEIAVEMHLRMLGKWNSNIEIEVSYPDLYGMSKTERANILVQANTAGALPPEYVSKQFIALLNDSENEEEILAQMGESNAKFKQEIENAIATTSLKNNQKNENATNQINEQVNNKNNDLTNGNISKPA